MYKTHVFFCRVLYDLCFLLLMLIFQSAEKKGKSHQKASNPPPTLSKEGGSAVHRELSFSQKEDLRQFLLDRFLAEALLLAYD